MDRDILTRTITESVVDRCIREIEEDPKRSVRKLVDLGRQLARGRFQRQYLDLTQKMLEDEESPYYTLVRNVVRKADHDAIKTFGINLGLGSWTNGARIIRALEAEGQRHIPWGLTLHLDASAEGGVPPLYRGVIEQGKTDGIFTYFLRADAPFCGLGPMLELVRRESACAFLLFAPPEAFTPEITAAVAGCHNLSASVDTEKPGWEQVAHRLEAARCLYGVYRTYEDGEQAREITTGNWLKRVTMACCPALAFCFAGGSCPEPVSRRVEGYIRRARTEQYYSVFLMDFFSDYLYVDEIISGKRCFLGLRPDGTLTRYRDGCEADTEERLDWRALHTIWGLEI